MKTSFHRYLTQRSLDLQHLDATTGVARMLSWYETERVTDAISLDQDGDMLLLQWGTYDWGEGNWFEYNITRQVICSESGDDDEIWQLGLTLRYQTSEATASVGSGNRWCFNPAEAEDLRAYLEDSDAAALAARLEADQVDLSFGWAG